MTRVYKLTLTCLSFLENFSALIKQDVREVAVGSESFCFLPPTGSWKRNVSNLSLKKLSIYCGYGSETFRFLILMLLETKRVAFFKFFPPLFVGSEGFASLPPE